MRKAEYTHIRVSKELHAILKSEAEARGVSIANYISELLSSIQSIGALISSDFDVNTDGDTSEELQKGSKAKKRMLRSGFEPESLARKAEMIGRATLPEHKFLPKESEF